MRVIGVDPSVRSTGYAVLDAEKDVFRAVCYGRIHNPSKLKQSECLVAIHAKLQEIITQYAPQTAAVEGIIYVQNRQTAIALGAARGAVLIALTQASIPIYEYPARRVKQATTGLGQATKNQVGFMMRAMLGLTETPQSDEADALAIALAHAQKLSRSTALMPEPL